MTRSTTATKPASEGRTMRRQVLLGWVFVAVWSVFVLGFDGYIVWSAARQVHAGRTWQRTMGTIASSEVVTGRGSKGKTTFRPQVKYSYSIDGKTYSGSTIEVAGASTGGRKRAERIVRDFPPAAARAVYVDPGDPSRSALVVGLQPGAIMMLMFVLPFNAVLLGGVAFLLRARGYADDPMRAWIVHDDGNRVVLRLINWAPFTVGCLAMGVISFVGLFIAMFAYDAEPPIEVSGSVIAAAIGGGLLAWAWQRAAISSGRHDVEIDRALRRVTLPRRRGTMDIQSLRFESLAIAIGPDGDRQINKRPAWKMVVGEAGAEPGFVRHWMSRPEAHRIAGWIARECGTKLKVVGNAEEE